MAHAAQPVDPRLASFRAIVDARPLSGVQIGLLILLVLLLLTDGYDVAAMGYAAPALAEALGVKRTAFTPALTAGQVGLALGALGMTPIADRFGARRVLIACAAWYAALTVATGFADNLRTLTVLRLLTGLGLGGAMPNAIALVSDYAPSRLRTVLITLAVCGFSIGSAFGGLIGSVMLERFGWASVFFAGGVTPLLILPLLALMLPESPLRLARDPTAPPRLIALARRAAPGWDPRGAADAPAPAKLSVAALFAPGYAVPTLLLWLAFFMNLVLLYLLQNWLPLLMHGAGFSVSASSRTIFFFQGGGTIGAVMFAWLCDRGRPQNVLAGAFAGAAVFMLLLGSLGTGQNTLMTVITAAGFCVVGGQIAANALAGSYYPAAARATGVGWALGIGRLGSIVGPSVAGLLLSAGMSMETLFKVCAIPALVAAAAIVCMRRPDGGAAPAGKQARRPAPVRSM